MVKALRIAFFGTPAFAVPSLHALIRESPHAVVAVVTQPDRPRGRGHKVRPEAVTCAAIEAGIPVLQPERLKDPGFGEALTRLAPDLGVVAAYGKLLPDALLALPPLGMINVHASLLPRWRGAAPVHRAILAGDQTTGVTIMRVVTALDAGPVLAAAPTPIDPDETSAELEQRLASLGARLLVDAVDALARGDAVEVAQDASGVTYAARLSRSDGDIDWARPAVVVHNQIRGLHPWPLATALFRGRRTRLIRAAIATESQVDAAPGTVDVATRPGGVRISRLQVAGRPAMPAAEFLRGHPVEPGDQFLPLAPEA
jgi:methionyl-tRNA formyltransferase